MLNSSLCSCILNDTCVANTPCANNSTCVLGSSPDKYTCDCTGTNFMGANCLGKEMLMIKMTKFKQYLPQCIIIIIMQLGLSLYICSLLNVNFLHACFPYQ